MDVIRKSEAAENINVNEFDPLAIVSPEIDTSAHLADNDNESTSIGGNEDDPVMEPTNSKDPDWLSMQEEQGLSAEVVDEDDRRDIRNKIFETPAGESSKSFGIGPRGTVTHMSYSDEDAHNENVQLNNTTTQLYATDNNNHIDLNLITEEYEKSMATMSDEVETWKSRVRTLERDKVELIHERDQTREDLHNIESAFSNLHSKYERMKDVLVSSRKNQNLLESRDLEMQDRLAMSEAQITEMEDEFKEKISSIYASFEARIKNQDLESTRLRAQLRKLEMKNETLENEVKQKSSEVSKLSLLCDELINKV